MKQFVIDIIERIKTATGVQFVALFNQQYQRILSGQDDGEDGFLFLTPAVFIEFDFSDVRQLGAGYQMYEVRTKLHIVDLQADAADGTLDQNLQIFDIKNDVFLKVQKFKPTKGSEMVRVSEIPDYSHNNLYIWQQEYVNTLVANEGKDVIGGLTKEAPQEFNFQTTTNTQLIAENGDLLITENNEYIIAE